jgi:cytochrome c peroxidase
VKIQFYIRLLLAFISLTFFGCKPESNSSAPEFNYPTEFGNIVYPNQNNKPTPAGIELGRHLFYDVNLSANKTISCGSCHAQVHGFADHNLPVSFGIFNRKGVRNSPAIFNLAWSPTFMWDGGIRHLDVMPIAPFTDTNEMGMTLPGVINRIKENSKYNNLYQKAFPGKEINEETTLLALSQFMLALISNNSKYDQVKKGKAQFNHSESVGYELFKTHCNSCHTEPLFTNYQYEYNGIVATGSDKGRYRISQIPNDEYRFKVPTIRNAELTYPYMHNGSIRTLDEVLTKYVESSHIESNRVYSGKLQPISLSESDRKDLIAFIKTITDYDIIANPKFSEIH